MPIVKTRLGRWFYEERGDPRGPATVLLHGLFFDGRMWERQVPALAKAGRVIVLDGPGHGRSDLPPPFTLEDQADAVAECFDELGVGAALVIGLSWGAMVALRIALAHPTRVRGLAVLGANARVESRRDVTAHRLAVALGRRLPLPDFVARSALVPMILSPRTVRDDPALVDRIVQTMQSQPREGVARASVAVVRRARCLLGSLPSIRTPALVLCGEDDRTTPPALSRDIAERIPGARLSVLGGCGHMTALEQPERVSEALAAFRQEIRARTES